MPFKSLRKLEVPDVIPLELVGFPGDRVFLDFITLGYYSAFCFSLKQCWEIEGVMGGVLV